jgi:hypothetical protein
VILDNLGSHRAKAVRRTIRDAGVGLVFLPKYSPDLNPIEQVFAKFKNPAAKGGSAKLRGRLPSLRSNPHPIPARRMRRIHQERRICVNLPQWNRRPKRKTHTNQKTLRASGPAVAMNYRLQHARV